MKKLRPWLLALAVVGILAITAFALWQMMANRTPESAASVAPIVLALVLIYPVGSRL